MLRPSSTALARLTAAVEKPTHGPDQYVRVLRSDVEALLRLVERPESLDHFEVPVASADPYRDGSPQRVEAGFSVFRVFMDPHAPLSARSYILRRGPGSGGFYSQLTPDEVVQASMGGGA